jgi:hypothetical protein
MFPEKLALRVPIFVGPAAEVMFEGVPCSMEREATLVAGTLFLYGNRLHIVASRFDSRHRRRTKAGRRLRLPPEHRAAKIAAVRVRYARLVLALRGRIGHESETLHDACS